ncbi:YicC family protein [Bacillus carboniphilus]|uniref:YicC family protein n=1 Tax=Bacillus carboniphilus TaxID=86663 RepID=A0ABN0WB22_9BACI
MIMSMTGYGRSKKESGPYQVSVELKAVNHRFCEVSLRIPRSFIYIEDKIKKKVQSYIRRGRVEGYLNVEGEGLTTRSLQVDWELLDQYVTAIKQVKQRYSLQDEMTLPNVIQREDFFQIVEKEEENLVELEQLILDSFEEAVKNLANMRQLEGQELKKDLLKYIDQIQGKVNNLEKSAPLVTEQYKERLEKRLYDFQSGQLDENRLLTEVAIFADKADISEELTRLTSHCTQFLQSLESNEPVGRKLDFIIQEMNREINTIGSKANDKQIAQDVVELKTILEKMREQVQNIE